MIEKIILRHPIFERRSCLKR